MNIYSKFKEIRGRKTIIYLEFLYSGNKYDSLCKIIEKNLNVKSKYCHVFEWGDKATIYKGDMQGIRYEIKIGYVDCPSAEYLHHHYIDIKKGLIKTSDRLTKMLQKEIKGYKQETRKYLRLFHYQPHYHFKNV